MHEVTVLIVEDNPELLNLLLQSLPVLGGFNVVGAKDGMDGLIKFDEIRPDCVVVDVRMPELNGYQFVRALRGDAQSADTPLIILTALTTDRDRFVGMASGVDLFLNKPVLPFDLAQAIHEVMARTSAERQTAYQALVEENSEMEVAE